MKSKTTNTLVLVVAFLLISVSGWLGWHIIRQAGQLQAKYGEALLERYVSTGNLSYLLEATVINPNRSNLQGTADILLENGEYQTAKTINYILNDPDFNNKAAEAALFNLDYRTADEYLGKMPEGLPKKELISFLAHLTEQSDAQIEWQPQTDAGKLLKMVEVKDFNLYTISYTIGDNLSEINKDTDKEYQKLLSSAQSMSKLGYYYLALNTLTDNTGKCNTNYFLIKAETYDSLNQTSEAVTTIEQGLACDSVNINLLNTAANYHRKNGNLSQADFYLGRVTYLTEISK